MNKTLTLVIHGESGVGKSWVADTTPAPRLILDAEGGSKFTPSRKISWDGQSQPPLYDGTWDTVVVTIRDFDQMKQVFAWLNSGQHHFKSVVMDSLTELQKRCLDSISGVEQPRQQDWGALLRQMESLVRAFRDLTLHPTAPLESVVLICMSSTKDGRRKPHVQGQLSVTLPYFMDVVGYLYIQQDPATGVMHRRLLVQPTPDTDAKDRTNRLPGPVMTISDLNQYDGAQRVGIGAMIDYVYQTEGQ